MRRRRQGCSTRCGQLTQSGRQKAQRLLLQERRPTALSTSFQAQQALQQIGAAHPTYSVPERRLVAIARYLIKGPDGKWTVVSWEEFKLRGYAKHRPPRNGMLEIFAQVASAHWRVSVIEHVDHALIFKLGGTSGDQLLVHLRGLRSVLRPIEPC